MASEPVETTRIDGAEIAYRRTRGDEGRVGLVWLGGFHSDMEGEKAQALDRAVRTAGRTFLRFDYFGHGRSEGQFADGTIGRWRADVLGVLDGLSEGPLVLVGSSMGGWLALLAALARPERVKGLVLIAPAADFTERLMWANFSQTVRRAILEDGAWIRPSAYDPAGYPITRRLIEEARDWLLMDRAIDLNLPVRILQGAEDEDVPWEHSFELVRLLKAPTIVWSLIKDGDHRLSRPSDIALMVAAALGVADEVDALRQAASPSR